MAAQARRRPRLTCRFVILTIGLLSIPTLPRLEGMESFKGRSFHTFYWPHEPVELAGKRVGIIGTGATAIQVIGEIADKVGELTVFPAAAELERAAQQRPDLRRGDGRHPRALRRDLRRLRPHARRLRARARTGAASTRSRPRSGWRCGTSSMTSPASASG